MSASRPLTIHRRVPLLTAVLAALVSVSAAARASAQPPAPPSEDAHVHEHGGAAPALCLMCPASRESAGTSWQPDSAAGHHREVTAGDWRIRLHAQVSLVGTNERGPRGGEHVFSTNHAMAAARRPLRGGVFGVQTMWSLEPSMGAEGYPLLLQTGETADGLTPLVDRQHPHDLPMELAVTYARQLEDERSWFVYVAAVGAPAFGPPPFMHRASAGDLPVSPITHHWLDSMHITSGVITAGFVPARAARIEVSGFNGREADEKRWGFERPRLDSFAARLSINPVPSLAVQVSVAAVNEPEPLHPGADVGRLSASVMYSRQWRGGAFDATVAAARSKRSASQMPVAGGALVFPGAVSPALLAEAALRLSTRHSLVARVERAKKDELFDLVDSRHAMLFGVGRSTVAYGFDVIRHAHLTASAGAAASFSTVDEAIAVEYGGPPASFLGFLSIRVH